MNDFVEVKTVLGKKQTDKNSVVLSHEHICCCSKYLCEMKKSYFNKDDVIKKAAEVLEDMKKRYNLGLFVDCTVPSIGRDVKLLQSVSKLSGVDIICSSGFYYGYDPILNCMSFETLADFVAEDAKNVNAGVIKAAVENENISQFDSKLLKAVATAQNKTGLPIVLHTEANNKNGKKAVEILLNAGAEPSGITVGHLSDTEDIEYIKSFAKLGCFVALDLYTGLKTKIMQRQK